MKQVGRAGGGWLAQALAVARNGWIVAGLVLLLSSTSDSTCWPCKRADLSFALPLTAASYPLAALLARFYLREDVGTARWVGTLLITAGVAIVAFGDAAAGLMNRGRASGSRRPPAAGSPFDGTARRPLRQLRLHQVEQIADPLHGRQFLGREPHAKLALDPHHQPDHVHRVETQGFAKVLIVLRQWERFAHLLFEQVHERRAERLPG